MVKQESAAGAPLKEYPKLKVWRCGDVLPQMNASAGQLENLQKGTSAASRYNGKTTATAKRIFVSRAVYAEQHTRGGRKLKKFILTYRYTGEDSLIRPEDTKAHINRFLNWVRSKKGLGATFWLYTLELTSNGQYHYHFMLDSNFIDAQEINRIWGKIRGDYAENAVRDIHTLYDSNGAAGYAAKYFTKNQELVKCAENGVQVGDRLKGLRLWATSNNLVGNEFVLIDGNDLEIDHLKKVHKITIVEDRKNADSTQPANEMPEKPKILFEFYIGYMSANKAHYYFEGYERPDYDYKNHKRQQKKAA